MQIDEFNTRPAQDIPDQVCISPDIGFADGERRTALGIDHSQSCPTAGLRHLRHQLLHSLQIRLILASAALPLAEKYLKLRVAVKGQVGINPSLGEPGLDLLPLLLGDHRQGAVVFAAYFLAQVAIADDAEHADQ